MSEFPSEPQPQRNIWLRGLLMILMLLAYQLTSTLLWCVALIQFVLALLNNSPNSRLMSFGRSLGLYQGQIANFISFATQDPPFPFTDWPSND